VEYGNWWKIVTEEIRRTLQNLKPGARYIVRARTINPFGVTSEWSEALEFTASGDLVDGDLIGVIGIAGGGTNSNEATLGTEDNFLTYNGTRITASAYDETSFAVAAHTHLEVDITNLNHVVNLVSNVAQDVILGRVTAGSGDSEELTATQVRTLINVEDGADATDATNVAAAGAVMESDTTTVLMSFVIDEDNMSSDSATKVPTQQSVKAYVDAAAASSLTYEGGYNAATNTPDLDVSPSGVLAGDTYTVTVAGTFFTVGVEVGDVLIAEADGASAEADWTMVNRNIDAATTAVAGIAELATTAEVDTGTDTERAITPDALSNSALQIKVNGVEALADVTDATNVATAGAVMESDTTTAAMSFVVDEDNMTSDSATKVSTQQSIKAYVDASVLEQVVELQVTDPAGSALSAGDGQAFFVVPTVLNGMNLTSAHAAVITAAGGATPGDIVVQIYNVTQAADMLTTEVSIDGGENTSYTAATAPVIDTGNDDVATGDILRVDVDSGAPDAYGLVVMLGFTMP